MKWGPHLTRESLKLVSISVEGEVVVIKEWTILTLLR